MEGRRGGAGGLDWRKWMFAGQAWQTAGAQSQLKISRATAYRLLQLARDEERAAEAFLDDRHGHPYKLTEPVQVWLVEGCTRDPQIPSSRIQAELKTSFGIAVSVGHIHPLRAQQGVTKQKRGQT